VARGTHPLGLLSFLSLIKGVSGTVLFPSLLLSPSLLPLLSLAQREIATTTIITIKMAEIPF
jgi:hypothetical protein